MRFYMLSDLHLGVDCNFDTVLKRTKKLCTKIRSETSADEEALFVFMGDLVEKGAVPAFEMVRDLLDFIRKELHDYKVLFEFLPGNHDLTSKQLAAFDRLISEFGVAHSYMTKSVYSKIYDGVNFIFADSNISRDHHKPKVNEEEIRGEILEGMENLLFCHHGFTQDLGGDHDCVEGGWAISKRLRKAGIGFLFHGHTHRADRTISDEFMIEMGCGSLSQDLSDMPSGIYHQFSTGYIQDGKIVQVERWIDQTDGAAPFSLEMMFPEQRRFADPDSIGKEVYDPVAQPYISGKVLACESATGGVSNYFTTLQPLSLMDAWDMNKNLLLLGDAGQGKSVELQNLAHLLGKTRLFPFLYLLRDYTGSPITDLLPVGYRDLLPSRLALIFDGYDELTADYRSVFEKELNAYVKKNPAARIMISSRGNFCKSEYKNESRTFPGFSVYNLCKLSESDIADYLRALDIDVETFRKEAESARVLSLLDNPFYLSGISGIFLEDGRLPDRANIMRGMIEHGFGADDGKYTDRLEEHRYELFCLMEKVSLAMQLMQKYRFDDGTEYQRLFSWEKRDLIRHSGLLTRSGTSWQFTHNNFREYLAAQYLSKLPFDQAVYFFSVNGGIKPSWGNILGYLTDLWQSDALKDWLIEYAPNAMVKFEPDRVEISVRFEILKKLFDKYEKKALIFSDELCSEEELAQFSCCAPAVNFLLEKISPDVNSAAQYNALRILQHFPRLFGQQKAVSERLLSYCAAYPNVEANTCRLAIHAIYRLNLVTEKVTEELLQLFRETDSDYIRLGLYEYLTAANMQDAYVDFFLDGIRYIEPSLRSRQTRVGNEAYELKQGLQALSTPASIASALEWFTKQKHIHFYDSDSVFGCLVEKAAELYCNGEKIFFTIMVDCCLWAASQAERRKEDYIIGFFERTDTLYRAVVYIINRPAPDLKDLGVLFCMHPQMFDCAEKAYLEHEFRSNPALFREIVVGYVRDPVQYARCAEYVKERDGIALPVRKPPIDYEEIRRRSREEYLSIFFDQGKAERMLLKLLEGSKKPGITVEELCNLDISFEIDSAQLSLQYALCRYVSGDIEAKDFFKYVDWSSFVIIETANELKNEKALRLTAEQRTVLSDLVCKSISDGALDGAIKYNEQGMTISRLADSLVFLAIYLDCTLEQENLLQMTELPDSFFEDKYKNRKYEYLMSKLPQEILTARIIENLFEERVRGTVLQDHLKYCDRIHCEGAVEIAYRLCTGKMETKYSTVCCTALQYLYDLMGKEYIESEIIPVADGELLFHIATSYKDISRNALKKAMEQQYLMSPTPSLQSILISFNSRIALEQYVEEVCKTHAFPKGDHIYVDGPTHAIAAICEPDFLPLLGDLIKVVFSPDFHDREFGSLYGSLIKAFINCGNVDADAAIVEIKRHFSDANGQERNLSFCNYLIEEILRNKRTSLDIPLSIEEVEKLFAQAP